MPGFTCPFCGITMSNNDRNHQCRFSSFDTWGLTAKDCLPPYVASHFFKCPECGEISICIELINDSERIKMPVRPNSEARQFPDYIPKPIRQDYEEACSIVTLSPKASATLARRCLQGMIRDFWGIQKNRLIDEINELQGKISEVQWKTINALRKLGNIGAHMEKDVNLMVDIDPSEAQQLVKLIELLLEKWYVARHDEEQLQDEILQIAEDKDNVRNS